MKESDGRAQCITLVLNCCPFDCQKHHALILPLCRWNVVAIVEMWAPPSTSVERGHFGNSELLWGAAPYWRHLDSIVYGCTMAQRFELVSTSELCSLFCTRLQVPACQLLVFQSTVTVAPGCIAGCGLAPVMCTQCMTPWREPPRGAVRNRRLDGVAARKTCCCAVCSPVYGKVIATLTLPVNES
jgi:hypothetical protein